MMKRLSYVLLVSVLFVCCIAKLMLLPVMALADIGPEYFVPVYITAENKSASKWMEDKQTRAQAAMMLYADYCKTIDYPVEVDLERPVYTARDGDVLKVSFFVKGQNSFLLILYKVSDKEAAWKVYEDVDGYIEVRVNNTMADSANGSYMNYPDELINARNEIDVAFAGKETKLETEKKSEEKEESEVIQDRTIFVSDGVTLTLDSIEIGYNVILDSYTLDFTVNATNEGDQPIVVGFETISLNGYETRCLWGFKVGAGKKAKEKVTLFNIDESTDLTNADDIETVEFCCYTDNADTSMTLTKNLGVGNVIRLK